MYRKKTHIHFVGIGGIGMSGIAKILCKRGYIISGCDIDTNQKSIRDLKELKCKIYQGNNTTACKNTAIDILVYSSAIPYGDPEIIAAQEKGIPTISRALMLAELLRTKYSILISGSHGKTTTTSIIAHLLIEAKRDPMVIVGGHIKNISTNARLGNGEFFVAEADESDKSVSRLNPTLAVLTNIDLEHLDVYRNIDEVKETFRQFLSNVPFYGKAFVCADDIHIREILPFLPHVKTIKYGIESETDYQATCIKLEPFLTKFTLRTKKPIHETEVTIPLVGRHNVLNTLAAIAVSRELGISLPVIKRSLETFGGIERRFSFRGAYHGTEIFDDYGHHPTEIYHTLLSARIRTKRKLIVVFQPHRYSRTKYLWGDFIKTFTKSQIDHLIITDIYSASEAPIPEITSERLAINLNQQCATLHTTYVPYQKNFNSLIKKLKTIIQPDDLVLLLGAGSITKLAEFLMKTK